MINSVFSNKFLIYGLIDPNTDEIRYIGKTTSGINRIQQHGKPSSLKNDGNTYKANWINKLKENKQTYKHIILYSLNEDGLSVKEKNQRLYEEEQFFIDYYKYIGANLTNSQDGGIGSPGRICSKETRQKMSYSAQKRPLPKALIENQKSKYPEDIIENGKQLRFCNFFNIFLPLELFSKKPNGKYERMTNKGQYQKNPRIKSVNKIKNLRIASPKRKPIIAFDLKNNTSSIFMSMKEAARCVGGKCSKTGISKAIKRQSIYYNFQWSFI